jgi:hypothetical protein
VNKSFLFLAVSLFAAGAQVARADSDQVVRVHHDGPALFAHVDNAGESNTVIAYKSWGYLAASHPVSLNAVVSGSCRLRDNHIVKKLSVVKLGREWNGTGYMSPALDVYELLPEICLTAAYPDHEDFKYDVAFSDEQGHWDSKYGANYSVDPMIPSDQITASFDGDGQEPAISPRAWNFIVDQMRR